MEDENDGQVSRPSRKLTTLGLIGSKHWHYQHFKSRNLSLSTFLKATIPIPIYID